MPLDSRLAAGSSSGHRMNPCMTLTELTQLLCLVGALGCFGGMLLVLCASFRVQNLKDLLSFTSLVLLLKKLLGFTIIVLLICGPFGLLSILSWGVRQSAPATYAVLVGAAILGLEVIGAFGEAAYGFCSAGRQKFLEEWNSLWPGPACALVGLWVSAILITIIALVLRLIATAWVGWAICAGIVFSPIALSLIVFVLIAIRRR
jgi:hypothetical protein